MAPVVHELRRHPERFYARICAAGQHRSMLDQALGAFSLVADTDLDLMNPGQTLSALASAVLARLPAVLECEHPDLILVQGDTTTAFVASLAAFHERIPIAHVEAGLRTGDLLRPYPEEANRRLISVLADLHFAPTQSAAENLLREGVAAQRVHVTGNTVIDALLATAVRLRSDEGLRTRVASAFPFLRPGAPLVLITGHRRESFGPGFEGIGTGSPP